MNSTRCAACAGGDHGEANGEGIAGVAGLAAATALAACGGPPTDANRSAPAPEASTAAREPTVEELQARAAANEADAERLRQEIAGQDAAPPAATVGGAGSLASGDETLHSGQYYDTVSFEAQAGERVHISYDAQGYQPVIIILGPDRKPASQAVGPAPDASGGAHLETDATADQAGTWYALLSATAPGAGGTYRVDLGRTRALN